MALWRQGFRHAIFFRHLINQGHVVLDLSYTMAHKRSCRPWSVMSKKQLCGLNANAPRYGIDEDRIVVAGGSAGAHLALLTAYTPNQPQFQPNNITDDIGPRCRSTLSSGRFACHSERAAR